MHFVSSIKSVYKEWICTCFCLWVSFPGGSDGKESESESHSVVSNSLQPMDYSVDGILQARILEWVIFPFSRGSSQPRDQTQVSYIAGGFFTS